MDKPLVSIVTPSYNQAPFLTWTLRSVLHQDYPYLEYIVVDGGSTDGSVDIIKRYAHRLAWWTSEPDQGQADALRKGFARAQGEILGWVNSDDMLAPHAVAHVVEVFQEHPDAVMVIGEALFMDTFGRPFRHYVSRPQSLADLMAFTILPQPAVFFRRRAFEAAGGIDPTYHYLLDHHLWLRLALQGHWVFTERILAFLRFHPQAKNLAQGEGFAHEAQRLLEWMQTHPVMQNMFRQHRRRILAAGYRFMGRYLLDAGKAPAALAAYLRAWWWHPSLAAQETHRMVYAVLRLFGLGFVGPWYLHWSRRHIPLVARQRGWYNLHHLYVRG